ncbi:LOW QUALITY PROTEIN: dnaJ homolog subfamily C member 17-like [Pristis pectinata]|uniref:LOW QUALITY PROTEIN: dnaJ homolog subfamily C member 17-like n=1 Tax=Pristis pectinata TaxID=685728 RepID=UPI00223DDEBB|nr:LOW QUALITY PROTEIN: dnaJ homolog subfamily C member 17-like [Pristis pectinata]
MAAKEILQLDLYSLLGVREDATGKEVKKAYRRKALKCHPDKNPDNPKAVELFHQLSQALEVLITAAAKAAYDQIRKAKKQAAEMNQKHNSKRKKVKLDLEAREREVQLNKEEVKIAKNLDEVIAKLRGEGSRNLQQQQRLMKEQIMLEREQRLRGSDVQTDSKTKSTPKLKLKWKGSKDDKSDGDYSYEFLLSLLQKYGKVLNLLISSKKKGSAIGEFSSTKTAELAFKNETGLISNPLKISWLEGQPPLNTTNNAANVSSTSVKTSAQSVTETARTERDYKSLVMKRMQQAAERQRLIEELQKDDD